MRITPFGRAWEWRHSIWLIWLLFPFGFLAPISFLYISIRGKKIKWLFVALGLGCAIAIFALIDSRYEVEDFMYDMGTLIILLSWIVAWGFALGARREYLQIIAKRRIGEVAFNQFLEEMREQALYLVIPEAERPMKLEEEEYEDIETTEPPQPIQINKATADELRTLPAIDSLLANNIVEVRKEVGQFKSYSHLVEQLNIQPHLLAEAQTYIAYTDAELKRLTGEVDQKQTDHTPSRKKDSTKKDDYQGKGKRRGRIVDY